MKEIITCANIMGKSTIYMQNSKCWCTEAKCYCRWKQKLYGAAEKEVDLFLGPNLRCLSMNCHRELWNFETKKGEHFCFWVQCRNNCFSAEHHDAKIVRKPFLSLISSFNVIFEPELHSLRGWANEKELRKGIKVLIERKIGSMWQDNFMLLPLA